MRVNLWSSGYVNNANLAPYASKQLVLITFTVMFAEIICICCVENSKDSNKMKRFIMRNTRRSIFVNPVLNAVCVIINWGTNSICSSRIIFSVRIAIKKWRKISIVIYVWRKEINHALGLFVIFPNVANGFMISVIQGTLLNSPGQPHKKKNILALYAVKR